jgi:hypothetical protein
VVIGLKTNQVFTFARPLPKKPSPPLFFITDCGKRHQDVLPAPLFAIFCTSGLLSLPESEIRAGKLLVDSEYLQEELVHCYRRARPRCSRPRVDRALQKKTCIAEDHARKLPVS